ncbi:MAG: Inner membrane protein YbiR [Firmicutes bacterium ADurb.Bin354]|nr:MAG: Inner membrane protein YbiR [Firmicutes bacterium ADurb.Bin354]
MFNKIIDFVKKETVLSAAAVLAVLSAFIVRPDAQYASYINFRVLAILTGLMIVMEGFKKLGVFARIAGILLSHVKSDTGIGLILIGLCFGFSMFITNDVALITFVPLTIETLKRSGRMKHLIHIVAMQTAAANLGSMLTPVGNPQNLYLYDLMQMEVGDFILLMLPLTAISGGLIFLIFGCWNKASAIKAAKFGKVKDADEFIVSDYKQDTDDGKRGHISGRFILLYTVLFVFNLLTVFDIVKFWIPLAVTVLAILITDRKTLIKVDYSLIFIFIAFFIFVGNMGRIPEFSSMLGSAVEGREMGIAILSSQVISNVPAALLLSGFTEDYRALLYGVDIGGLGTLIASMASLISYKYVAVEDKKLRLKYLIRFTVVNIMLLIPLYILGRVLL